MIRAWLTGNERRIAAHIGEELLANAELRRVLLTARNEAWTGRVAAMIEGGERPFVAVGAAHMVGEDGLAARLAALGYSVRRIQ